VPSSPVARAARSSYRALTRRSAVPVPGSWGFLDEHLTQSPGTISGTDVLQ
jgi:hypothetical protein